MVEIGRSLFGAWQDFNGDLSQLEKAKENRTEYGYYRTRIERSNYLSKHTKPKDS